MTPPTKVYYVVVTGAGGEPEGNPSPAVRDGLPIELSLGNRAIIKILKYPRERTCSFRVMRETNREIWSQDASVFGEDSGGSVFMGGRVPHIDLVLHIGKCTQKSPGYWIESNAKRDVYRSISDDEGQMFPVAQLGPGGLWEDLPTELRPCFDADRVARVIVTEHQDVVSGRSDDAGASFCELELYSSLAVCHDRHDRFRAGFLHIPPGQLPEDITKSVAVTSTVIRALVEQVYEMDTIAQES